MRTTNRPIRRGSGSEHRQAGNEGDDDRCVELRRDRAGLHRENRIRKVDVVVLVVLLWWGVPSAVRSGYDGHRRCSNRLNPSATPSASISGFLRPRSTSSFSRCSWCCCWCCCGERWPSSPIGASRIRCAATSRSRRSTISLVLYRCSFCSGSGSAGFRGWRRPSASSRPVLPSPCTRH